jgi:uracil-DNA glycosylase
MQQPMEFDPGPPADFAAQFAAMPDHTPIKQHLWFDWGPIFYRGRLDGTARVLCIASDPGPTERIAGRTLVGDAGQRVQGFLAKLGLTRSYLCLNAFAVAVLPDDMREAEEFFNVQPHLQWRNQLFDLAKGAATQAIVAFGRPAQRAVAAWPGHSGLPVFEVPHPSSREPVELAAAWRAAIASLRAIVTPDGDGSNAGPNYGVEVTEEDYLPIPRGDLPFGAPWFLGDDRWVRDPALSPPGTTSVSRPSGDRHTLIWIAPTS